MTAGARLAIVWAIAATLFAAWLAEFYHPARIDVPVRVVPTLEIKP